MVMGLLKYQFPRSFFVNALQGNGWAELTLRFAWRTQPAISLAYCPLAAFPAAWRLWLVRANTHCVPTLLRGVVDDLVGHSAA